jgi:hypothetical protein
MTLRETFSFVKHPLGWIHMANFLCAAIILGMMISFTSSKWSNFEGDNKSRSGLQVGGTLLMFCSLLGMMTVSTKDKTNTPWFQRKRLIFPLCIASVVAGITIVVNGASTEQFYEGIFDAQKTQFQVSKYTPAEHASMQELYDGTLRIFSSAKCTISPNAGRFAVACLPSAKWFEDLENLRCNPARGVAPNDEAFFFKNYGPMRV